MENVRIIRMAWVESSTLKSTDNRLHQLIASKFTVPGVWYALILFVLHLPAIPLPIRSYLPRSSLPAVAGCVCACRWMSARYITLKVHTVCIIFITSSNSSNNSSSGTRCHIFLFRALLSSCLDSPSLRDRYTAYPHRWRNSLFLSSLRMFF